MQLILASQSPRRKQLLEDAAIDFEIFIAPTDESYPENMPKHQVPEHIATEKAIAAWEQMQAKNKIKPNTVVLGADTIVLLNDVVIGKPKDAKHAIQILQQLSGKMHEVITGVCLKSETKAHVFHSVTKVFFNKLTLEQIEYYVAHYQPFDKAGAYAIQEWIGLIGIQKIEGDIYNVIGLPVNKVVQALHNF